MTKAISFPLLARTYQALGAVEAHMNQTTAPSDGLLTARVIGEFSAGKTRLLRELFGALIPERLFPISSLERQTRLPLEITYGDQPQLTLIEKAQDYDDAQIIEVLNDFPRREDVVHQDTLRHRLRLALPEPRLILSAGDGYSDDQSPKRLFLIDMPGWNSGDDAIAEAQAATMLTGYHNLALIYVVDANRLDSDVNDSHLKDFLEAFEAADFVGKSTLLFVVTHCPKPEQLRFADAARQRVLRHWTELDNEPHDIDLQIMCVEFAEFTANELQQFRDQFWKYLLAPMAQPSAPQHPWINQIRNWTDEWDIRPQLALAQTAIQQARDLIARARDKKTNEFLPGMNMTRLLGLNKQEIGIKLQQQWLRQLKCSSFEQLNQMLALPETLPRQHPLSSWWRHYWRLNLENTLQPTQRFFIAAEAAIDTLTPDTTDLTAHFAKQLTTPYQHAEQALDSSFTCLVESVQTLATESQLERVIATLFKLSIIESRYADHYEKAKASLV